MRAPVPALGEATRARGQSRRRTLGAAQRGGLGPLLRVDPQFPPAPPLDGHPSRLRVRHRRSKATTAPAGTRGRPASRKVPRRPRPPSPGRSATVESERARSDRRRPQYDPEPPVERNGNGPWPGILESEMLPFVMPLRYDCLNDPYASNRTAGVAEHREIDSYLCWVDRHYSTQSQECAH